MLQRILPVAFVLVGSVVLSIVSIKWEAPLLSGDNVYFYKIIQLLYNGDLPIDPAQAKYDPEGIGRFVWHGYIAPIFINFLMIGPGYKNLVIGLWGISILISMLSVIFAVKWLNNLTKTSSLAGVLSIVGFTLVYVTCRPESIAAIFVTMSIWFRTESSANRVTFVIQIVLITLLFSCSPQQLVLFPIITAAFLNLDNQLGLKKLVSLLGETTVAVIMTILLASVAHPFGVIDWLQGMLHHYSQMDEHRSVGHVKSLLFTQYKIGVGFVLVVGMGLLVRIPKISDSVSNRFLLILQAIASILPVCLIGLITIRDPLRIYVFVPYLPLSIILAWRFCVRAKNYKTKFIANTIALTFGGLAAGNVVVSLYKHYPAFGLNSFRAAKMIESFLPEGADIANNFEMTLVMELLQKTSSQSVARKSEISNPQYLILSQANTSRIEPNKIEGFSILHNCFRSKPLLQVVGRSLINTASKYNFVVYISSSASGVDSKGAASPTTNLSCL
jgi:hypothetical protein